jgi:hypothetical protein
MAEARAIEIVDQLRRELQRVTVANGFHTDFGADVRTELADTPIPAGPRCTVVVLGMRAGDADAVAVEGVIEIALPTSHTAAMATIYRGADDIERLLAEMPQRQLAGEVASSDALLPLYAGTAFLPRPEGMPFIAAEITFTTGYRR